MHSSLTTDQQTKSSSTDKMNAILCWMRALSIRKKWKDLKQVSARAKDVLQNVSDKNPGASARGDPEFQQWQNQVFCYF